MRGDGRVFFRGRWAWISYMGPRPDGRWGEIRESAKTRDVAQAQALLDRRRREVRNHVEGIRRFIPARHARLTVRQVVTDLLADYQARERKIHRTAEMHSRRLLEVLGSRPAGSIDAEILGRYVRARKGSHAAVGTIDRELDLLRRGLRLAVANRKLAFAPDVPRLATKRHGNARQGFFAREDFFRLLAEIKNHDFRDFLEWTWWTGWRLGETSSLTWAAHDRDGQMLRLAAADTKANERPRAVPLTGPLEAIFERRVKARKTSCLLVFHDGGRPFVHPKGGLHERHYDAWFAACVAAKLPGREAPRAGRLIPYDLRRTAARNLVAAGVPIRVAMEITGHETREMFDRYCIVESADLVNAFHRVQDLADGKLVAFSSALSRTKSRTKERK